MQKKWQDFERIIAAIHAATDGAIAVTWNDEINGRQFDVSVRFKYGMHDYLTVIECKDYSGKVSVDKVDAFATKTRDINANKAVIVAANGFQSGCLQVAQRHGITLLTLHESFDKTTEPVEGPSKPALSIYRVRLVKEHSGDEVEFEEWNGKLEYLIRNCKLLTNGKTQNPIEIIEPWLRPKVSTVDYNESRFEIDLPPGTVAEIPFEEPFNVSAIRFHCRLVTASVRQGTVLSRHLRELKVLQHELHDCITGGVVYKGKQSNLNLGFDVELASGKFYLGLNGTSYYYCVKIEDGLVTFLMIESYQHSRLIQAEFAVTLENAKGFVEVKDKLTLIRLQKMLDDYKSNSSS